MNNSLRGTWGGAFAPLRKGGIVDHFDVVGINYDEVLGMVYVRIEFYKTPGREYLFEIEEDKFQPDKESIAEEVLRQLKEG